MSENFSVIMKRKEYHFTDSAPLSSEALPEVECFPTQCKWKETTSRILMFQITLQQDNLDHSEQQNQ